MGADDDHGDDDGRDRGLEHVDGDGLVCLNPEYVPDCRAGGCCSPICDADEANTCPGVGQVCVPFYDEGQAPEGYETVGLCGIPQ